MSLAGDGDQAGRELHVLAVDDSSVDLAVIARLLRSSKHRGIVIVFVLCFKSFASKIYRKQIRVYF